MAPPPNPHSSPDTLIGVLPLPLPLDALFEILLLLPAKDLCHLRAVSRSWRSLLSGPDFIAAHAARHPQPLIVTGYNLSLRHPDPDFPNEGIVCDIMDLCGHIVKRVRATPEAERVMSIQPDLICTAVGHGFRGIYQLLNPATGAARPLPKGHAPLEKPFSGSETFVAFGKVASTGEHRVLRVIDNAYEFKRPMQVYEVCTLDGSNNSSWRASKGPLDIVYLDLCKNVVIGEIVYFLSYVPDRISSFDLETEGWRDLQGPQCVRMDNNFHWLGFSMATLSGSLVAVHRTRATMDLWFLMDFERGLWVKQHSISMTISVPRAKYREVCPLLKLNDGRIVLVYLGDQGLIRTYNPRNNTFTDMAEMGYCVSVGLYTGSLLSLPTIIG